MYPNQAHCGVPARNANLVTTVPYDPSCPDQCAKVTPFNGQGRAIQPGESNCKVQLTFDNRTSSVTRYVAFGPSSITQDEDVLQEFIDEGGFELPEGVVAADFFNFDENADQLAKLNAILNFRLYEFSRINIRTTGDEDVQSDQFNQELQQTIIGADPFDYCPKPISGLACSYCPDSQQIQTYDKCSMYVGKHTLLLLPVAAEALIRFEACVCGYTLVENLAACGSPQFPLAPLPMLPYCPEGAVVVTEGQQFSNGRMVNGVFVPNAPVNGAPGFNAYSGNGR